MTLRAAVLIPLCLTLSAWCQLTYTVPVVDKSDAGSPLEISGSASFTENVLANAVASSSEYQVMARNVYGKGIVLLVAYFDEAGPHGGGAHHVLQFDDFFRPEIGPGEWFVLAQSHPGSHSTSCCVNPLQAADEPRADVRVQFAQFSDGSAFGDEMAARDILAIRSVITDSLRRLDETRTDQEFLHILAQKIKPEAADGFLEWLRQNQAEQGTAGARKQVRTGLANAEKHMAAMNTPAANN